MSRKEAKIFRVKAVVGKAPSGRGLAPKATGGECVFKRFYKLFGFAGSFRHFLAKMPPPSRREAYGETRLQVASRDCMAGRQIKGSISLLYRSSADDFSAKPTRPFGSLV